MAARVAHTNVTDNTSSSTTTDPKTITTIMTQLGTLLSLAGECPVLSWLCVFSLSALVMYMAWYSKNADPRHTRGYILSERTRRRPMIDGENDQDHACDTVPDERIDNNARTWSQKQLQASENTQVGTGANAKLRSAMLNKGDVPYERTAKPGVKFATQRKPSYSFVADIGDPCNPFIIYDPPLTLRMTIPVQPEFELGHEELPPHNPDRGSGAQKTLDRGKGVVEGARPTYRKAITDPIIFKFSQEHFAIEPRRENKINVRFTNVVPTEDDQIRPPAIIGSGRRGAEGANKRTFPKFEARAIFGADADANFEDDFEDEDEDQDENENEHLITPTFSVSSNLGRPALPVITGGHPSIYAEPQPMSMSMSMSDVYPPSPTSFVHRSLTQPVPFGGMKQYRSYDSSNLGHPVQMWEDSSALDDNKFHPHQSQFSCLLSSAPRPIMSAEYASSSLDYPSRPSIYPPRYGPHAASRPTLNDTVNGIINLRRSI